MCRSAHTNALYFLSHDLRVNFFFLRPKHLLQTREKWKNWISLWRSSFADLLVWAFQFYSFVQNCAAVFGLLLYGWRHEGNTWKSRIADGKAFCFSTWSIPFIFHMDRRISDRIQIHGAKRSLHLIFIPLIYWTVNLNKTELHATQMEWNQHENKKEWENVREQSSCVGANE